MSAQDDRERSKRERIDRLRVRLEDVRAQFGGNSKLVSVLKGILDLLADEL